MAFTIVNAHFRERGDDHARHDDRDAAARRPGCCRWTALVTHRFPLEQINEAFATLRDKPDGLREGRRQPERMTSNDE